MRHALMASSSHPAILVMLMTYALEDDKRARAIMEQVRSGDIIVTGPYSTHEAVR